jgi:nuclear pore complex protein Nup107
MLPLELASKSEPEDHTTEYLHYRQFFTIWETLARVVECQSLEVQHMNKDTRAAWLKDYMVCGVVLINIPFLLNYDFVITQGLVDQAHEQIIKLLTSEWLVSDVEDISGMMFLAFFVAQS